MRQLVSNLRSSHAVRSARACALVLFGVTITGAQPSTAQTIVTVHHYPSVDELEIVLEGVNFLAADPKVFLVQVEDAGSVDTVAVEPMIRDVRPGEVRVQVPSDLPRGRYRVVVASAWSETDVTPILRAEAESSADGAVRRADSASGPGLEVLAGEPDSALTEARSFLVARGGGGAHAAVELASKSDARRNGSLVASLPTPVPAGVRDLVVARRWAEKIVTMR